MSRETAQRNQYRNSRIARDSIVRIMAYVHLLDQFRVLFDDRMMSVRPTPRCSAPRGLIASRPSSETFEAIEPRGAEHRPVVPGRTDTVRSSDGTRNLSPERCAATTRTMGSRTTASALQGFLSGGPLAPGGSGLTRRNRRQRDGLGLDSTGC